MEKLINYANIGTVELKRQFENLKTMNILGDHTREEVEKEVDFTKAAMADVKNQVAQYNLPQNHERAAIFNKIETIFGQMKVHPQHPTYWNRTNEEALSYHLHNSTSTAETLRNLVKDLWTTVKEDKIEKDLHEYRQKKLKYLTKKEGDVKGEERSIGGDLRKNEERNIEVRKGEEGDWRDVRNLEIHPRKEEEERSRRDEENFEGGRMQGDGERVSATYMGSNAKGDERSNQPDYQFHKAKQNEGLKKEGYLHPPRDNLMINEQKVNMGSGV
jgi:hypothetical protein